MTDPFDQDELLLEDEWVELCDQEGRRASFRHLATIGMRDKLYMILGDMREGMEEPGALMLIREDETADGVNQYVVVNDKKEIEFVVRSFVMRLLTAHMDENMDEKSLDRELDGSACGCRHRPGEFCFCDNPAFLQ